MTYEGILFKIKAEEEKKVGHTFKLQWMKERHKGWGLSAKLGKHSAKFPPNRTMFP